MIKQLLVCFVLLSSVVLAAGGGSGGGGGGAKTCNSYSAIEDRIKCRLDKPSDIKTGEESCAGSIHVLECQNLYKEVTPCYEKEGVERDKCLKQVAGFSAKSIAKEKDKEAIRKYVTFLLYDVQYRTEEAFEDGKITSDQASQVIGAVIRAKQVILRGSSNDIVKSYVQTVKESYKDVFP